MRAIVLKPFGLRPGFRYKEGEQISLTDKQFGVLFSSGYVSKAEQEPPQKNQKPKTKKSSKKEKE